MLMRDSQGRTLNAVLEGKLFPFTEAKAEAVNRLIEPDS